MSLTVGFVHPGAMGAALGACCGPQAVWASAARSSETVDRANSAGLVDLKTLEAVVVESDIIVSICPPHAAISVAESVAELGFGGLYVDANAISPATMNRVADIVGAAGADVVDGSVIGVPPETAGTTRLYLAGERAGEIADLFASSPLDAPILDGDIGAASALKMAYASWTKVATALLLGIRAYAEQAGVGDALVAEWELSQPAAVARTHRAAAHVGPKAWRFVGEMDQIADAFAADGLPAGFAQAASQIYGRLDGLKGHDAPSLDEVISRLVPPQ